MRIISNALPFRIKSCTGSLHKRYVPERLVIEVVDVVRVLVLLFETLPDFGLLQNRPRLPAARRATAPAADRCRLFTDACSADSSSGCGCGGAAAAALEALQRALAG